MTPSHLNVALAQARGWTPYRKSGWWLNEHGKGRRYVQKYATDPAASLDLIEFMRGKGYGWEARNMPPKGVNFAFFLRTGAEPEFEAVADTFPLAVAKAACLALGISET